MRPADRMRATAELAWVLFCDAILFTVWIALAWLTGWIAAAAESHGVNETFATAFRWVSSAVTFVLTVCFVIADVADALRVTRSRLWPAAEPTN